MRDLDRRSTFSIEPFDKKAAIESIAASRNAAVIYSDDPDIAKAAPRRHITVVATDSLPIPSSALQKILSFESPVTGESDEGKP